MDNMDYNVLMRALEWLANGSQIYLVTVLRTWGSAPRPVGSHAVIRGDGLVLGSVSGGCIEDDLVHRICTSSSFQNTEIVTYGIDQPEARRWGLPCGGKLELVVEPIKCVDWIDSLLADMRSGKQVGRILNVQTGEAMLVDVVSQNSFHFDGTWVTKMYGPQWRLLIIGAGQLSEALVPIARLLDFEVYICDPRSEYRSLWPDGAVKFLGGMPDDAIVDFKPDVHTAIVALTHDPKLDDMALLEALKSDAFYVGALGSRANNKNRRERLALFDLTDKEIARLYGPIGLYIGSRTPGEIAVSIAAELVSVRNGIKPQHQRTFISTQHT